MSVSTIVTRMRLTVCVTDCRKERWTSRNSCTGSDLCDLRTRKTLQAINYQKEDQP